MGPGFWLDLDMCPSLRTKANKLLYMKPKPQLRIDPQVLRPFLKHGFVLKAFLEGSSFYLISFIFFFWFEFKQS
jgi:hypothetical protein